MNLLRSPIVAAASGSRLAVGVFVLIALATTAYSVTSNLGTRGDAETVQDNVEMDHLYQGAIVSVTKALFDGTRFTTTQEPSDREAFDADIAATLAALQQASERGTNDDRALVADVTTNLVPQLSAVQAFFRAIERGEPYTGPVPSTDAGEQLRATLEQYAARRYQDSLRALKEQSDHESIASVPKLGFYAIGLVAALICLQMIRSYGRRDVAARLELRHLREAAHSDPLTGLGNHRSFQEDLQFELAAATGGGHQLSLALLDVDEFKEVNDTWGHSRGDELLTALAAILRREAEHGLRMFRIGGDEFAVILPDHNEMASVVALERIRESAAAELECTVSIGVAELEATDSFDLGVLRGRADAALYEAKRTGRNAVVPFGSCAATTPMLFSDQQVHDLRVILQTGRMGTAFQPIWDMETNRLLAFEALARPLPGSGISGPQEAFDIAERIGKSHELDAICRRAILARGHEIPRGVKIFLNLSPYTLNQAGFSAEALVREVRAAGIAPQQVVIEITELSTVPAGIIASACLRLRAAGFSFALDDVGAGNAGLEMLRKVPVDFVKIDRGVIVSAMTDPVARAVLAAIVAFASSSGARVVAEGIEDQAMLDLVLQVGDWKDKRAPRIHAAQGYYLGEPSEDLSPAWSYHLGVAA